MKTAENVVLCPGCYGYGEVTDKRLVLREDYGGEHIDTAVFFQRECDRCNGSGRVLQWTEDKPYVAK